MLTATALAATLALSPDAALGQVEHRVALRFEGGVGSMLSDFQRSERGFGVAWQGRGRLAFVLGGPVALELSVAHWVWPLYTFPNPRD